MEIRIEDRTPNFLLCDYKKSTKEPVRFQNYLKIAEECLNIRTVSETPRNSHRDISERQHIGFQSIGLGWSRVMHVAKEISSRSSQGPS